MNIFAEIFLIYGITFLVSMFVAFIIWGLAKLVEAIPEGSFSLIGLFYNFRQNIILRREERKQVLREFREIQIERNKNLNNYHHEHA